MSVSMAGWLALSLAIVLEPGKLPAKSDAVTLSGKVVELSAVLKATGQAFDAEPIARQVVLHAPDGTITPLLSNEASRALFLDNRLRERPAEIRARRFSGMPYVQVLSFQVVDGGTLRTPEYYCEVCSISVRSPQSCPCCQGPMDLRMRPESR